MKTVVITEAFDKYGTPCDSIVFLSKLARVDLYTYGSGAKSNPYSCELILSYEDGHERTFDFRKNVDKAREIFNNIQKVLSDN